MGKYLSIEVSPDVQNATGDIINQTYIEIYYTQADLDRTGDGDANDPADINEERLSLLVYQPSIQRWIGIIPGQDWVVGTGVNTTNIEKYGVQYEGFVWARLTHFSLFGIAGVPFDEVAPLIGGESPTSNALMNVSRPIIGVPYTDGVGVNVSGINKSSVRIVVDYVDRTSESLVSDTGVYYTPSFNLTDGMHQVTVSVTDVAGNVATKSWQFTVDTIPPEVVPEIVALSPLGFINDSSPEIRVSFFDASGLNLSSMVFLLDMVDISSAASVAQRVASYTTTFLADGTHVVEFFITDNAGNTGHLEWSFVVDTVLPDIFPSSPLPSICINDTEPLISANFTDRGEVASGIDPLSASLRLDGMDVTAGVLVFEEGIFYEPSLPLTQGTHILEMSVADNANNERTVSWFFTVDIMPPLFDGESPSGYTNLTSSPIGVNYSDSSGIDLSTAVITLDSVDVTQWDSATFSGITYSPPSPLAEGSHSVEVSIKDIAGNKGVIGWSFFIDTEHPTVSAITIDQGSTVHTIGSAVTIRISASYADNIGCDQGMVVLTLDGTDVTSSATFDGNQISYSGQLGAWTHTFTLEVYDLAGNASTTSATVSIIDWLYILILLGAAVLGACGIVVLKRRSRNRTKIQA
jgi:hypothetical protein